MQKLTSEDLLSLKEYDLQRDQWRQRIAAQQEICRILLGPDLSLLFQSRDMILFELQEILRARRLRKEAEVRAEIDVYNTLIPDETELFATLFLEFNDKIKIQPILNRFSGMYDEKVIWLQYENGETIDGEIPHKNERIHRVSPVYYLGFRFDQGTKELLKDEQIRLTIHIDHHDYKYVTPIGTDLRKALFAELNNI